MSDSRSEKFSYNWMDTVVSLTGNVELKEAYHSISEEAMSRVDDILYPVICETGFYEQTNFSKFHVVFVTVDPAVRPVHEICIRPSKRDRILGVDYTLTHEEMLAGYRTRYEQFIVDAIAKCLMAVCSKYKLNDQPVRKIAKRDQLEQIADKAVYEEDDEAEEFLICVKLAEEFPSESELVRNTQLMDQLDDVLQQDHAGRVVASDCGAGYETIVCKAPNVQKAYRTVKKLLSSLPCGSFVQFAEGEQQRRIDIPAVPQTTEP